LRDERATQLICPYCRAELTLSNQELRVLGQLRDSDPGFQLPVGQSFQWRGARYEVIARIALIEDGDVREMTHEYYLYNPRRSGLVLSEYGGEFSLSWASRVSLPETNPAAYEDAEGSVVYSGDGEAWAIKEVGEYQVYFVDGALPYKIRVGERIEYVDFTNPRDSAQEFELQRSRSGEVEYGRGHYLSLKQVEQACGKKLRGFKASGDQKWVKRWCYALLALTSFALIACIGIGCDAGAQGHVVLNEMVSPSQVQPEYLSAPFPVASAGDLVRVTLDVPSLQNEWIAGNLALVKADADTVIHVFENDVSYYSGVEGGESWSEGSSSSDVYISVPEAGDYRLLFAANCGFGNSERPTGCRHAMGLRVKRGVLHGSFSFAGMVLMLVMLIICFVAVRSNNGERKPADNPARLFLKARYGWIVVVVLTVLLSAIPTYARAGGQELEHPEGISIRQSSAQSGRSGRGFFLFYNTSRRHLGGGIGGGK